MHNNTNNSNHKTGTSFIKSLRLIALQRDAVESGTYLRIIWRKELIFKKVALQHLKTEAAHSFGTSETFTRLYHVPSQKRAICNLEYFRSQVLLILAYSYCMWWNFRVLLTSVKVPHLNFANKIHFSYRLF